MAAMTALLSPSFLQLASHPCSFASRSRFHQLPAPAGSRLIVRAAAPTPEQDPAKVPEPASIKGPAPASTKGPDPVSTIKKPKVSTRFSDVFAFSGPAPETINGRLAMLGFAAALGVEAATGNGLVDQITNGGISWFLLTGLLISAASLVPMFKGVSKESKSGDIMSAQAETWNGRAAMLGLVALAITEYVKAGPLV